jgi:transcriptional regulator with XRE-family HTH domain
VAVLYVKNLFRLGKSIGIEQQQVAAHVGVSEPTVSLWATGKRPVPDRHKLALLNFFDNAIEKECKDADRRGDIITLVYIRGCLLDFTLENYEASGRLYDKIKEAIRFVATYQNKELPALLEDDWDALVGACLTIQQHRGYLKRIEPLPWAERMIQELAVLANTEK